MAYRNRRAKRFAKFFQQEKPKPYHFAIAAFVILLSVVTKVLLSEIIGWEKPFLLLFSAVAISGLIGGARVGIFATALAAIAARFLFLQPSSEFGPLSGADLLGLVLFIFDCMVITQINGALRSAYLSQQTATEKQLTAARALSQSQEIMRRIFDQNVVGIQFIDFSGGIVDANNALLEMLGFNREDLRMGKVRWDALTPVEHAWVNDTALRELRERGFCRQYEKEYFRKDGSRVPVLMSSSRVEGHPSIDAVTFVLDISDRKKMERSLAEINEKLELKIQERTKDLTTTNTFLEALIQNIPNMIFVKDAKDLRFVRFNKAGEELLGMKQERLLGKNDYDFFPKEQADHFTQKDRAVLDSGELLDIPEEKLTTPRGEVLLHTKKIPIVNANGESTYLLGISEDITEWKKAEVQRLRFAEERAGRKHAERLADRLRFLSEASAILGSSLSYQVVLEQLSKLAVPRIADWCTIQMRQPDGSLKQLTVAHNDPEKVKWAWELYRKYPPEMDAPQGAPKVLRTGKSEFVAEVSSEHLNAAKLDGDRRAIISTLGLKSYICAPIKSRGRVFGVLTLFTTEDSGRIYNEDDLTLAEDLAERAGLAVENAQLYQEATSVNRMKDEFLATLSHELRTPLNVIQGHADILKSEAANMPTDDLLASVDAIQRNAKAQTQIVQDILDVSAIITGKVSVQPVPTSVTETIRSAVQALQIPANQKNIQLSAEYPKPDLNIQADPVRMQQVIWNLLSNALKFTGPGGKVKVRAERRDQFCRISVIDTGKGIAPEFIPHVFERFRQEDAALSRRHGGLGLGLSIVKHLVEIHRGEVEVHSDGPGKGSTFTIQIPLATSQALSEKAEAAAVSAANLAVEAKNNPRPLSGRKILVLDDEQDNRNLVRRFLERAGAQVVTAGSAREALSLLDREVFDFIASDISMPDVDGFEFIERFRKKEREQGRPPTPAAALTAYTRDEERMRALLSGFQTHIAKPVNSKTLVESIRKTLASFTPAPV